MQPNNQQGYTQPVQPEPGQIVSPPLHSATPVAPSVQPQTVVQPPAATPVVVMPAQPAATPAAPIAPQPVVPAPAPVAPQPAAEPAAIAPEPELPQDDEEFTDDAPVTWTAQEYLHQEKGTMWFILFGVVVAALVGLSIWTQAWTFTALIAVITVLVIIYARRPPRELTYSLTDDGLTIDNTLHAFSSFKSFGVVRDGQEFSVMLIPTQRFQPSVTVYFPEEAGEDIVDILGSRLPMKDLRLDAVDRLVRLLRL